MGPRAIMDRRETEEGVMGGRPIKPPEKGCRAWMCLNAGVHLLDVLEKLRLQVPRPSFETWLKDTVGHTVTDSEMMVLAPTQNTAEWLERRMYQSVFRAVEQVLGRPVEVQFLLRGFDD